jgi:RHS repeat-associated protein
MRLHQIFLSAMFLLAGITSRAGEAPFVKELSGNQVVAANTLLVVDDKLNPAWNALISSYQSIDDIVSFEIDFGTQQFFYNQNFTAKLDYTLIRYKNDLPDEVQDSLLLSLSVDFKNDGSGYKGVASYKFNGSRKFMLRIKGISSAEMVPIKPIFKLRGQIQINRKYLFNPVATDTMRFSKNGNQLRVFWQPSQYKGGEEFDLEYTYIDKESAIAISNGWQPGVTYNIAPATLNSWFTNNASRIVTDSSAHTINLINAEGFLLFRIRHVQYTVNDNVRVEGEWNYRAMSLGGYALGVGLVSMDWHEPDMNWQYSVSFAEEGKKKEVVTYFDGSLRNRQMVTINNSDNVSVVQESVYDRMGRPALQVLPSPTTDNTIHYFKSFTRNQANYPYSFMDLGDGTNCAPIAAAMAATSGASKYYSPQNDFAAQRTEARHIADAENYPYTATSYTNDNTGRIKAQGGVGATFQLNSGKETKYYYGKPSQTELDRLFGVEAGDASHYLKNMVIDPNGQVSVSYVNAFGKTVATALAGAKPTNLEVVDQTFVVATNVTNEIIKPNDFVVGANNSITASSTFMAALPGTYTLSYSVNPMKLSTVFGQNKDSVICSTCYYDLEIKVRNDCNELLYTETVPQIGPLDSACASTAGGLTGTRNITVAAIGEYNVTYTLTVSRAALDSFDNWHLARNTEIRKRSDFVRQELLNADFYGCFTECSTCVDKLGTKINFSDRFRAIYLKEGMPFTLPDSLVVNQLYDSLYQNCQQMQANCATRRTPCDDKLDLLKADVRPGGQYGLIDSLGRLTDLNTNVIAQRHRIAFFTNENGFRDSVTLVNQNGEDSIRLDVKQLNDSLFVIHYRDSWGDSLAKLHPEYCYYLWCTGNVSSYVFDKNVEDLMDGNAAVADGLFARNSYNHIMGRDPFFTTGAGVLFKKEMDTALAKYSREYFGYSGADRNILQMVDLLLYCSNQTDPYATCSIDNSCRAINREWEMYKRFYLNLKQRYYERARIADPAYAGCVNCFIGQDLMSLSGLQSQSAEGISVSKAIGMNDVGYDQLVADFSNGVILSLSGALSAQDTGFALVRIDSANNVSWVKKFNGQPFSRRGMSVGSGNKIFIAVEAGGFPGVISLDSAGNVRWSKNFTPDNSASARNKYRMPSVSALGTGVLLFYSGNTGGKFYLSRIDDAGSIVFSRNYDLGIIDGYAVSSISYANLITAVDTTYLSLNFTLKSGVFSRLILKVNNKTGAIYWTKMIVSQSDVTFSYGHEMAILDKGLVVFGDYFYALLDEDGNVIYTKELPFYVRNVTISGDGSIVASVDDLNEEKIVKFEIGGRVSSSFQALTGKYASVLNTSGDELVSLQQVRLSDVNGNRSRLVFHRGSFGLNDPSCVFKNSFQTWSVRDVVSSGVGYTTVATGFASVQTLFNLSLSNSNIVFEDFCKVPQVQAVDTCKPSDRRRLMKNGVALKDVISDGAGVVAFGSTDFNGFGEFPMVIKFDSSGKRVWSGMMIPMSGTFYKGIKLSDGGYVAVGDGSSGFSDGFVVKFASDGTVLWNRQFNFSANRFSSETGYVVRETAGGEIILLSASDGYFQDNAASHVISKFSATGALVYARTVRLPVSPSGALNQVSGLDLALDGDTAYVYGSIKIKPDLPPATQLPYGNVILYKINHSTQQLYWSRVISKPGSEIEAGRIFFGNGTVFVSTKDSVWSTSGTDYSNGFMSFDRGGNLRVSRNFRLGLAGLRGEFTRLSNDSMVFSSAEYTTNRTKNMALVETRFNADGTLLGAYRYDLKGRFSPAALTADSKGDLVTVGTWVDTLGTNNRPFYFKTNAIGDADSCGVQPVFPIMSNVPVVFRPLSVSLGTPLGVFTGSAWMLSIEIDQSSDSSFCTVSCERPAGYVNKLNNCPDGLYQSFERTGVRHRIVSGVPGQMPATAFGFNSWKFYSVFMLRTSATSACQFTNVWVASCEKKVAFSCPSNSDFSGRVTTPLCENGTKLGASLRYTGPAIPANASVTVQASFQSNTILWFGTFVFLSGQTESYQCSPFPLNSSSISVNIQAVYCNLSGIDTSCISDVMPPSYCSNNQLIEYYATKQKRFPEYVNLAEIAESIQNTDLNVLANNANAALNEVCHSNCDAQADYWISVLSGCTSDSVKLALLKEALVNICKQGCSNSSLFGSSSVSNEFPATYRNFEEAIVGILGEPAVKLNCTQELIANPYPYYKKPVYAERVVTSTDAQICQKLASFRAEYLASAFSGSFYGYLVKALGQGMTMDSLDVEDMISACTTCRHVLKNDITLPAAFEANQNALTCSTANALRASFTSIYGNDSTHVNFETVFTNYFNHQLGFALSYDEYLDFFRQCAQTSTAKLYNRGMQKEFEEGEDDCLVSVFATVITNANLIYTAYIDSVSKDFRDAYVNRCLNASARLTMTSQLQEYQYTLYYYDQSGNLVKTVPPAGVVLLTQPQIDAVQRNRAAMDRECFSGQDQVRFNNTGHYTFANNLRFRPGTSAFSIEGWFKFRSYTTQGIFGIQDTAAAAAYGQGYLLQVRNDTLVFRVAGSASSFMEARSIRRLSSLVPDTNWRHIVVQKTNIAPALQIFINGVNIPVNIVNTGFSSTVAIAPIVSPLRIGGMPVPGGSQHFNGSIRQFRYYLRTLPATEVRQNFLNNCLLPASQEGLTVWSLLNEGTGVIQDEQGAVAATVSGTSPTWFSNRVSTYNAHTRATIYEYNTFNQVKRQVTPDGGPSNFWYDRLGRLVVSQNEEQRLGTSAFTLGPGRFSYTRYDALGRITEVGERLNTSVVLSTVNFLNNTAVTKLLAGGTASQITKTIYDQALFPYQNAGTARKRVSATTYQDDVNETSLDATYYSYDIMGNVKTLIQRSRDLIRADNANGEKRIDYAYDLISGKVNRVTYQPGKGDQFIHRYSYDADNRIISVNTSRDGLIWQNDAKYVYHLHGPLARTELGDLKVQGMDYAYTLQGWLKGVNSSSLEGGQFDIGQDGKTGGSLPIVARDAYGYMLDYYRGDYKPIGQQQYSINSFNSPATVIPLGYRDLFNGNIAGMLTNIRQLNEPMYYGYTYDQLNRIKSMDAYRGQNAAANTWSTPVNNLDYQERISYDPNGNITNYQRNGRTTTAMDNLSYSYTTNTNKLRRVTDAVPSGNYTEDLDNQTSADNYTYDLIGNLKTDAAEGISAITWTVYGKIKQITKGTSTIFYRYDAAGNRTSKAVTIGTATTTTYYVRDAQGNVMAVYEKQAANPLRWTEQHLYGSSRLGMWTFGQAVPGASLVPVIGAALEDGYIYGTKFFELSNHLGNVLVTVSDKKIGVDDGSNGTTDFFLPEVLSAQDYYPFGMAMPDRTFTRAGGTAYRYGFNGMEKDNELKGEGLSYTTEYRAYDPRLGRWFSIDPKTKMQPWESPYAAMNNSPIWRNDPKGDIAPIVIWALKKLGDAAIGVMTDVAVQLVAEKYFGNNGQGHKSWEAAWNSLDIDWWQAIQSGGENLVKNKHLSAAISAGGDMLNYYFSNDNATWDGAFARGGLGAVSSYIGGNVSSFFSKYGPKAVLKGLNAMGLSPNMIKELKPCGCFTDSTLILTKEGYKEISKIKEGDYVLSYNDTTGVKDWKKVKLLFVTKWSEIITLHTKAEKIETTSEHPFYVNGKWKKAYELVIGDTLFSDNVSIAQIDSISIRKGEYVVYNLLVEDFHTFFVSNQNILVHNGAPCPVKFQGAGGMFGGNQWLNKGIHANVEGVGKNVEIGFKLNAAGDGIDVNIVNFKGKLKDKDRQAAIEYGQLFLEDKGNLQKLKEWFQAAKTNGNVPTSDHGTIDKTIEVIDKKLQ